MSAPLVQIPLGVIVTRRKAESRWIDHTWQSTTILVGQAETAAWTRLSDDGATVTFYAGGAVLELFRGESGHYRDNLAGDNSLWVISRPGVGGIPHELMKVTADPTEAEAYASAGDYIVEILPMPETLRDLISAFVAEHYTERPFFKRQQTRADPEALAPHRPQSADHKRMP